MNHTFEINRLTLWCKPPIFPKESRLAFQVPKRNRSCFCPGTFALSFFMIQKWVRCAVQPTMLEDGEGKIGTDGGV